MTASNHSHLNITPFPGPYAYLCPVRYQGAGYTFLGENLVDWFSMDTDVFRDGKIRELIRDFGSEGWHVFSYVVAETAEKIDIDNDDRGYFDSEKPIEDIEWGTRIDGEKVEKICDKMAELELIKKEDWKDGDIFIPTLLDRKQTETYLRRQQAGRKSAKNRDKGNSDGTVDGSDDGSGTPPALDVDKDGEVEGEQDSKNDNPESGDSEEFDRDSLIEEYGEKAVEFTDRMIEGVKRVNDKASPPKPGTSNYKNWVQAFDRLNRLGPSGGDNGYSWERLEEILSYAFKDQFWSTNVASPIQLRKKGENGLSKIVNIENSMEGNKTEEQSEWEEAV